VCKSTDAARHRLITVSFRSQYRPVFANWCDLAVGRPTLWSAHSYERLRVKITWHCRYVTFFDPVTHSLSVFCAHTLWIELQTLSTAGVVAIHCNDCWLHELHYCHSNTRSMLLSGHLSVISDHALCIRQKWRWYPCSHACPTRPHKWHGPPMCTRGGPHDPLHATHLGGPLPCMAAMAAEQLRRWSQLVRTAALRLDHPSPEWVPGNLFISRVISRELTTLNSSELQLGSWSAYFIEPG